MRDMPQHIDHLHGSEKRWFAVYTYFRREKSAVAALQKAGIDSFVPLIKRSKKYKRKVKLYHVPLINNYIFVRINKSEYTDVLQCRDVIRFIKIGADMTAVPEYELDTLKRLTGDESIQSISELRPDKIGQEVEIISGALSGLKAKLVEIKNNKQVVIDLENIAYSIYLEINVSQLSISNDLSTTGSMIRGVQ